MKTHFGDDKIGISSVAPVTSHPGRGEGQLSTDYVFIWFSFGCTPWLITGAEKLFHMCTYLWTVLTRRILGRVTDLDLGSAVGTVS